MERGADVNIRNNNDGWTALIAAAVNGHADIVQYLHQAGADINIRNKQEGWTAVMMAARMNHGEIVQYLRAAGAK